MRELRAACRQPPAASIVACRSDDADPALQRQHGRDDPPAAIALRARARTRGRAPRSTACAGKRPTAHGDQAVAEVAVVAHRARAGARTIARIGRTSTALAIMVAAASAAAALARQHGHRVGDAEREAAAAPARGGDAAHRQRRVDRRRAVERRPAACRIGDERRPRRRSPGARCNAMSPPLLT